MADDKREYIGDSKIHQRLAGQTRGELNQPSQAQLRRAKAQAMQQTMFAIPIAQNATVSPEQQERKVIYDLEIPQIYNFRFAVRQLKLENRRAEKFQRPLSVLIVGFPELPLIKDKFSSHAADACIKEIGKALVEYVELGIDIVCRFADEKFMVVLPELNGPEATMVAESIRTHFEKSLVTYQQYKIPIRASIGITCFPKHGQSWKELVAKADLAVDLVVESGGNAFRFGPL